jgi:DNA-3-methyladenine glycosylase II
MEHKTAILNTAQTFSTVDTINNYYDAITYVELFPPKEFSFNECLVFLNRSDNECLHEIEDNALFKLVKLNEELILLKATYNDNKIIIEFPANNPNKVARSLAAEYLWELFDLDKDLSLFYKSVKNDKVLSVLISKYYGLRVIGIPDLFEALAWAIMGQQINLTFAFTLKRHFVEKYGERYIYNNKIYYLFPAMETIAKLEICDLTNMQFTRRKSEYIIGVAKAMVNQTFTKETLLKLESYDEMQKKLISIRGVGNWTADYAIMKCLKNTSALLLTDVGLHNALKNQLELDKKPTIDMIKEMALNWTGWESYATFYLWRSLYD